MKGTYQNAAYITTFQGKFEERVPEDVRNENIKTRINKNGKKVHYLEYDYVRGYITDITTHATEWEGKKIKNLNITLQDGNEKNIIQLSQDGSAARCFFALMENIDYNLPVTLSVNRKEDRDTLFARQGSEPIKWKYTKDNPGGKPDWKKIIVKGEEVWDNTDEINFFIHKLTTVIQPILQGAKILSDSLDSTTDLLDGIEIPDANWPDIEPIGNDRAPF